MRRRRLRTNAEWEALVSSIRAGDDSGIEEFYDLVCKGMRYQISRSLGSHDIEDKLHEIFLIVVRFIQAGKLLHPERLAAFTRTIVRREIGRQIEWEIFHRKHYAEYEACENSLLAVDHGENPEELYAHRERDHLVGFCLSKLTPKQRELLVRFYFCEESKEQIMLEMRLTSTQFRLAKSRAKQQFGKVGRQHLAMHANRKELNAMVRNA